MSQIYGIEAHREHSHTPHRPPARYLVIIDSGGSMVARMFQETREQVAEFDAGVEEVTLMEKGLTPQEGALGAEWDVALRGHSAIERSQAKVYTLTL